MAEVNRSVHTVPRVGDRSPITELILGSLTLLIDRQGSLWFGTVGDGLGRIIDPSRIRGRRIEGFGVEAERFTQKDGLLSDIVHALLEDREGNIWIAGDRGLERFREGAFAPVATPGRSAPASSSPVGTRRSGPLRSAYTGFCGWVRGAGKRSRPIFSLPTSPRTAREPSGPLMATRSSVFADGASSRCPWAGVTSASSAISRSIRKEPSGCSTIGWGCFA
jgi:hypothetical protein